MLKPEDLHNKNGEAAIIATLIHNPDFYYAADELLPRHFYEEENRTIYSSIMDLLKKGVTVIDAFNLMEAMSSSPATRRLSEFITIDRLVELEEDSDNIARSTVEEYKMLATSVIDMAFRRDMYKNLEDSINSVLDENAYDLEQEIYQKIDSVMTEYSLMDELTEFGDVIDECWKEIESRQQDGYAGIPFKFAHLNDYVTMERGELVVFGAGPKAGKSIMLLNNAVDLLKRDKAVLYIDSELNTRLFTARLISHLTGIEYKRLTSGNYTDEEKASIDEQIAWMKTRTFVHVYLPMFDQRAVYTLAKKMQHAKALDCIIIDYFKGSADGDAWDSYAELGRFVDMVKNQICGKMGIYGLAAAQATENGKLADSAKIARNASTIIMIQDKSPEEMEEDGLECGNKKLRVIFNRNGMQMAPGEYIDMEFDGNHILYKEAKQHIPQDLF